MHYKWNRMYNICIEYDSRHQAAEKHVHCALCTSTKRFRYPIVLYRVEPSTHKLFSFDHISNRIIENCMNTINYVCSIYDQINNYCHSIVFSPYSAEVWLVIFIAFSMLPSMHFTWWHFHDYCTIWNFDRSNAKYGFRPNIEIWTSNMLFALGKMNQVVFIKEYFRWNISITIFYMKRLRRFLDGARNVLLMAKC